MPAPPLPLSLILAVLGPAEGEVVEAPEPAPKTKPVEEGEAPARPCPAPIGLRIKASGELGALGVLYHTLQFDSAGTNFDLRRDGRQDTMFLFGRLQAELEVDDHHEIVLLFQPLRLRSETVLQDELIADEQSFAAGTGLDIFYGFDFYRLSYLYDIFTDPGDELGFGLSLQFRNFRASYTAADGGARVVNTNFGPVPALKIRGRHELDEANFWYGAEIDGFYANIPYVNGGEDPIEGAIIDASVRAGVTLAGVAKPYLNLRYIGGGSSGTDTDKQGPGDGFTRNWLHTMAVSLGVEIVVPVIEGDREARDREIERRRARRKARRGR